MEQVGLVVAIKRTIKDMRSLANKIDEPIEMIADKMLSSYGVSYADSIGHLVLLEYERRYGEVDRHDKGKQKTKTYAKTAEPGE